MKTIYTFMGTLVFLALLPLCLTAQQSKTQNQTNTETIDLPGITDMIYYKQKMGFSEIPGFEPTGNIEHDVKNYQRLKETIKLANAAQSISPVGKPHPLGQEKNGLNDLCADAEVITCGQTVSGSTIGATFDNVGFCGTSNTANGVWYSFTPDDDICLTLSTCNQAGYDTKISVFTDGCGTLTCVAGQDDASGCSGFTSKLKLNVTGGTEYLILVHGFSSATGNFDLSVICEIPQTNASCLDAETITCGQTVSGSTVCGGFDAAPFCGTSNTTEGVWYRLTPENNACVTLSTCNQADYDTKISVYTDGCGTLTCVAGQDDNIAECGFDFTTKFSFNAIAGTEYLILVHGFASNVGNFSLSVDCLSLDAGACQSRFLGYGPAEEDINYLCASVSGGFPPYTFSWSPAVFLQTNGTCIAVQPDETTTYTVTVSDSKGCTVEDEVTVNVFDLAAPCNGKKNLQVCHVPPGNGGNEHEVCINSNAFGSHFGHGDRLGPCDNTCLATNPNPFVAPLVAAMPSSDSQVNLIEKNGIKASVYPNPFEGSTTIRFSVPEEGVATLSVYTLTGARVATLFEAPVLSGVEQQVKFEATASNLMPGVYFYVVRTGTGIQAQGKLVLVR